MKIRPKNTVRYWTYIVPKRLVDIALSVCALILLCPVLCFIAILIKFDSPGPVFFTQMREGRFGDPFKIYKFRSMGYTRSTETLEPNQTQKQDPRITHIGKFIRKTSIDELPQLINILRGDMSFVGPRPHPFKMKIGNRNVQNHIEQYQDRFALRPGLTGWAQIHGSRGPLFTLEQAKRRFSLDRAYIVKSSLMLDIFVILKTVPLLLGDKEAIR
ncbi:sugar transferase [Hellea sp.]|nr:sugar transferase [Hellea sp.]